jgi:hypothetical protein
MLPYFNIVFNNKKRTLDMDKYFNLNNITNKKQYGFLSYGANFIGF